MAVVRAIFNQGGWQEDFRFFVGVPATEEWVGDGPTKEDLGGGGGGRNLLSAHILDFVRFDHLITPSCQVCFS
jgi:hypothetical protein